MTFWDARHDMSKEENMLIKLLGRIEYNRIKAQREFDEMGEKFMGKEAYSKLKRKPKF